MRVAIIGGTGLIGSTLASELVKAGHQVLVLSRHQVDEPSNSRIDYSRWNGVDEVELAQLLEEVQAVVNLAGESIGKGRWSERRKGELVSSRLAPTEAVTAALTKMQHPPEVYLQASAVGIYGTGTQIVDEGSKPGRDFLAGLCVQWEQASNEVDQLQTRRIIIRSGVVLDAKRGIYPQMSLPFRLFVGGPVGSGRQWVSWIHLADEVNAIKFLLEKPGARGAYNLVAPETVTNADFGKTIARVLHRPYWMPVPSFALKFALGEMSTLLLDGQRVLPRRLTDEGFEFKFPRLESALVDLNKS